MAVESDQLIGTVDIDTDNAPAIEQDRLYRLWEEGHWSAKSIDFSQDILDWQQLSEHSRKAIRWNLALFLDGEESVTVTLAPFMEALTRYEDRIFLGTQIADEARHHVFFDRFIREVVGIGTSLANTLDITRPDLTWGYRQVFSQLDQVADQLRRQPRNKVALAQGVTLYHVVIESMLAHTGQHFLREYCSKQQKFPGFRSGVSFIARDESRHIAFGVQILKELVASDPRCKAASIAILNKVLPWAAGVFTPPGIDWSYIEELGYTPQDIMTFGLRSIIAKLHRVGIEQDEVLALVKLGADATPAQQAERVIDLIEGRVIGTDAVPNMNVAQMDALFDSIQDIARWTQKQLPPEQRTQGIIQWHFPDAPSRYLELGGPAIATVNLGSVATPRLVLKCTAADWGYISSNRLNQNQAVLTRRLRISGDWGLALKLPQILPV